MSLRSNKLHSQQSTASSNSNGSNSSGNSGSNSNVQQQHPPMAYQQQQQQLLQQLQQQQKFQAQQRGNTSRNNLATLVAAINGHDGGQNSPGNSGYQLSPAAASRVAHAPPHSPLGPPSYSAATAQSTFSYYGQHQQHQMQLNHNYQQQQQQQQQFQLQQQQQQQLQLPPPDLTDGIDHPSAQAATPPDSPNAQSTGPSNLEQQLCVVAKMQKSVTITVTPQRSNSMDFLNFEEKRQLIASSLSLSDILHSSNAQQQQQQAAKDGLAINGGQCGKFARVFIGEI